MSNDSKQHALIDESTSDSDYDPEGLNEETSESGSEDDCDEYTDNESESTKNVSDNNEDQVENESDRKPCKRLTRNSNPTAETADTKTYKIQEYSKNKADLLWSAFVEKLNNLPPDSLNEQKISAKCKEEQNDKNEKELNCSKNDQPRKRKTGLESVLNKINKKVKTNTLEESKRVWQKFKKDNELEDELSSFHKGKHGFLEKKAFLERTQERERELDLNRKGKKQ